MKISGGQSLKFIRFCNINVDYTFIESMSRKEKTNNLHWSMTSITNNSPSTKLHSFNKYSIG